MFSKIYQVKKDFDHKLILFTKTTPKNIFRKIVHVFK